MQLVVRRERCTTRGVDSGDRLFIALPARMYIIMGQQGEKENNGSDVIDYLKSLYLERGKSYGDRLPNIASCILSVFNVKYGHQRRLNYTRILSVELIGKTPKSVVSSGVGHMLTISWGQQSFNVSIKS